MTSGAASSTYSAIQPQSRGATCNATVEVLRDLPDARILRVTPDAPPTRYLAGQYGSLGLPAPQNPQKLLKRPYSLGSSILDEKGELLDHRDLGYYEFFINRPPAEHLTGDNLTPLIFALRSGERIFCGPKIVGFYTLKEVPTTKSVLLIGSLTGESPNNGIVNELLLANRPVAIAHINCVPPDWCSPYEATHATVMARYPRGASAGQRPQYQFLRIPDRGFGAVTTLLGDLLHNPARATAELGFALNPESCHVFMCGDPMMIGAPKKLGAWQYEYPEHGLLRLFIAAGFTVKTKFQEGTVEYETYW